MAKRATRGRRKPSWTAGLWRALEEMPEHPNDTLSELIWEQASTAIQHILYLADQGTLAAAYTIIQARNITEGAKDPSNDFPVVVAQHVAWFDNILEACRAGKLKVETAAQYVTEFNAYRGESFFHGMAPGEAHNLVVRLLTKRRITAVGVVTDILMARLALGPLLGTTLSKKSERADVLRVVDNFHRNLNGTTKRST